MKRITYRCRDDEKYKEFQHKILDNDLSFQEFIDKAVSDYLDNKYNPNKDINDVIRNLHYLFNELKLEYVQEYKIMEWLKEQKILPEQLEICTECETIIDPYIEHMEIKEEKILCNNCDDYEGDD